MVGSDTEIDAALAQTDAAPQRRRARGPHPLPALLALLVEACGADREQLARALAGVRAYQAHRHVRSLAAMPEVAHIGGVTLRDYGGSGALAVFVPSLLNPPTVLDLDAGNSLLRWLATQGVRPLLVDWGDLAAERDLDLASIITARLVPLLAGIGEPAALAGYCLGGTLALAAAVHVPATRIALLATPWHFSGYDATQREGVAAHAAAILPLAAELGALPMDLLQPLFWSLDRAAVAAKFAGFAARDPASAQARAFALLEDWANDGPALPEQVARDLYDDLFAADLPGRGRWAPGGVAVRPGRLGVPILDVVATRDRIVPATTALGLGRRLDLDAGHVGMIVGGRARALLWEPLADFLRGA